LTWAAVNRVGSGGRLAAATPAGAGMGIVGVELGADLGVVAAERWQLTA
jgi:hypothetical protein